MPHQNTVFCHLANRLPWGVMRRLIVEHEADKGVRTLRTEQMLLTMLLAQIAEARGLRDIVALLESQHTRRYHAGLTAVRRSTLADAAAGRPVEVFTGDLSALIASVRGQGSCGA